MGKYVLKRLLSLIPTVLISVFVIYFIMDLTPSDPGTLILGQSASQESIDALNESLGYNQPFLVRYAKYILGLCSGDLGTCYSTGKSVFSTVMARFPVTATLAVGAIVIGVTVGVLLGILSAVKQYSAFDIAGTTVAMILASFPAFWIGMLLILLFSLHLRWLPSYGVGSLKHYILPWITTSCAYAALQMRMTRTSMLEAIRTDYVRTARAKGQKESIVIYKHALRNALLPVVTMVGTDFGMLLGGTVTVEAVFSLPGIGSLIIDAIRMKDIPLVVGCIVILVTCFTIIMLIVDILYAFIDPRIKARYTKS